MGAELFRQHLIDPEACTRCNACEVRCPVNAISHDEHNYAIDPARCNFCRSCHAVCLTDAVQNWRVVPRSRVYSVVQQLAWDRLPRPLSFAELDES